jgi:hypothetical protein
VDDKGRCVRGRSGGVERNQVMKGGKDGEGSECCLPLTKN